MMAKDFKNTLKSKAREAITNSYSYVEKIKHNITVLDDLRNFIPPLLSQELEQLRANLLKDGCKDPLLVWETTKETIGIGLADEAAYVLVDGHNRYKLCTELGIGFNVQLLPFNNIQEVKEYMIDLQLGRRNLNPQQTSYLRGLRYKNEKVNVGLNFKKDSTTSNGQNDHLIGDGQDSSTAKKLAEEYQVSEKTIRRDADFASGLEKFTPQLRNDILSGKEKVDKTKIQKLAKKVVDEPIDTLAQLDKIVVTNSPVSDTKVNTSSLKLKLEDVVGKINLAYKTRSKVDLDAAQQAFDEFKQAIL